MRTTSSRCCKVLMPLAVVVAVAGAGGGCHKGTELEAGAVLLDVSVASGVTTPDELRVFVYDDSGTLFPETRVPQSGALSPQSPTHLGTVLIQPGASQGGMRIHVRGLAASVRVADGTMTIPPPPHGQFALVLDGAVPADGDSDGVPDAIDDCPGVANPNQGGCPGTNDGGRGGTGGGGGTGGSTNGGTGGGGGRGGAGGMGGRGGVAGTGGIGGTGGVAGTGGGGGASVDAGTDVFNCDASGACDRAIGASCVDSAQCHSTFCVDGVCCNNACAGPCRSCNQPNNDGMCLPYPQGTDPAVECTGGMTCNGVGSCGPAPGGPKKNGELCSAGTECSSTFCKDGVCCNTACDTACKSCATGTCNNVARMPDPPECYGTMTCNPAGKCVLN